LFNVTNCIYVLVFYAEGGFQLQQINIEVFKNRKCSNKLFGMVNKVVTKYSIP